ncbi:uncharacterized protein [Physcomitrium patens]|uniref:uncharacterized protein n=1 Tax=Physcomitrium patens TaxID=3218 RepID=UPI003CCCC036
MRGGGRTASQTVATHSVHLLFASSHVRILLAVPSLEYPQRVSVIPGVEKLRIPVSGRRIYSPIGITQSSLAHRYLNVPAMTFTCAPDPPPSRDAVGGKENKDHRSHRE